MSKVFVVGSVNMDLVINSPRVPERGETISGSGFMTNPGGKGANQAVAVSKLGGKSYMVGCVGDSFGNELKATLVDYGVNVDYLKTEKGISSGIAVIIISDNDNRIILDKGSNGCIEKSDIDKAFNRAEKGDYLICQLEISQEIVAYAMRLAKEKGMITVLNPAPAAKLIDGILTNCDYFTPNQTESEFYTGVYPKDEQSIKQCAEKLMRLGVKNVLITLGTDGSCFIDENEYIKVNSFKVKAIDTTAAGDTYVGAFVTALAEKKDIKSAMEFASKASSITVTRRGAQQSIPFRKEL